MLPGSVGIDPIRRVHVALEPTDHATDQAPEWFRLIGICSNSTAVSLDWSRCANVVPPDLFGPRAVRMLKCCRRRRESILRVHISLEPTEQAPDCSNYFHLS